MSTKRREPVKRGKVFGPDGVLVCKCGCGRPPGKGRRYWHSAECVEQWKIRNDPATVREAVWKRDRGVCAVCGDDTKDHAQRHREEIAAWRAREPKWELPPPGTPRVSDLPAARRAWWDQRPRTRQHFWEADHIVPVCEGGGQCGLENYRTLCLPCHRNATTELRKRIAERRRNENGKATTQEATALDQWEDQEDAPRFQGTDGHD